MKESKPVEAVHVDAETGFEEPVTLVEETSESLFTTAEKWKKEAEELLEASVEFRLAGDKSKAEEKRLKAENLLDSAELVLLRASALKEKEEAAAKAEQEKAAEEAKAEAEAEAEARARRKKAAEEAAKEVIVDFIVSRGKITQVQEGRAILELEIIQKK